MKSALFFKYAGMSMMLGGGMWFFYLYSSADARMMQSKQDIYRTINSDMKLELSETARDEVAVVMLMKDSSGKIKEMLYPFLLVMNGCSFLLINERKKAEQVAASDR